VQVLGAHEQPNILDGPMHVELTGPPPVGREIGDPDQVRGQFALTSRNDHQLA
jgi:hypothetical protein